jgi:thioredoxin reductase (NADPH)
MRMRSQAAEFGVEITEGLVEKLTSASEYFTAHIGNGIMQAQAVLLATGVINNAPPIAPEIHDDALARGLLRYCPICDGFEVTDKRVAVIGTGSHGQNEAIFLRMYSADITLIAPEGAHALSDEELQRLHEAGVVLCDGPCGPLRVEGDQIIVPVRDEPMVFDTVYPALGSVIRSELAGMLGAEVTEDGCLVVDSHQRTTVPMLYAAGDVAKGLDQISHAMGEAGVAATTIRNDLAATRQLFR